MNSALTKKKDHRRGAQRRPVIKCGVYRNVARFLAPLVTTPEQLAEALQMLDQALAAAGA